MMSDVNERLQRVLRAAGKVVTSQRLSVWQALNAERDHPTAAELHSRCPELPLATLYNSLEIFTELGLVHALHFPGVVRYDVDTTEHINVICTGCDHVVDVSLQLPKPLEVWVGMESGFKLSHSRVDWYGLCAACQAKDSKGQVNG